MSSPGELGAMSEFELYENLRKHTVGAAMLRRLGYPEEDTSQGVAAGGDSSLPGLRRRAAPGSVLRNGFSSAYECRRCKRVYAVEPSTGLPLASSGACVYHPGRVWIHELRNAYNCCKRPAGSPGCCSNECHVHEQALELCNYTGFVRTKARGEPQGCKVFAMDAEMCYTTIGLELTQLTLLDYKKEIVYETLCKPSNPILDYNTRYSGLRRSDLEHVQKTLPDVQRDLLALVPAESILVGHGLDSDMVELKMFHENFLDTVALYPHRRGLPWKNGLKQLVMQKLNRVIQDGSSHDSNEDARSAFDLALKYVSDRNRLLAFDIGLMRLRNLH